MVQGKAVFLSSFHGERVPREGGPRSLQGCEDETIWCPLVHIGQRVGGPTTNASLRVGAGYTTTLLAWIFFFQVGILLKIQQMYLCHTLSHKGRPPGSPPHSAAASRCLVSGNTGGGQALALTLSALVPAASGGVGKDRGEG